MEWPARLNLSDVYALTGIPENLASILEEWRIPSLDETLEPPEPLLKKVEPN